MTTKLEWTLRVDIYAQFPCKVCDGAHPTYECCDQCNYDTHICPGCGEFLDHENYTCSDCARLL